MGAAAAERARADFDERRVVATVLDTYRAVARRKGLARLERALDAAATQRI
jgi:hypothetical protein